jgi:hypothetical protein
VNKTARREAETLLWHSFRILAALPYVVTEAFLQLMDSTEGCMVNPENITEQPPSKYSVHGYLPFAMNGTEHQDMLQFIIQISLSHSTPFYPRE